MSRGKPAAERLRRGACTSMRSSESVCDARSVPSNVRNACSTLAGAARHQVGAAEMPCCWREPQRSRYDGRRLGSFLHSLSKEERNSPPGEDGGTILVRRVKPSSCATDACEAAAVGRLGTDAMVPEDDNGTSADGTISVKAPPAVATDDQARGVSIQNAARRCRTAGSGTVPRVANGNVGGVPRGQRMHRRRNSQSERERIAAFPLSSSGRANGSGPARAPTPNEGSR
jgi:hypothetical protein